VGKAVRRRLRPLQGTDPRDPPRGVGESLRDALDDALSKGTGQQELSSMLSLLINWRPISWSPA
jgi:hypothetical protein